MPRLAGCLNLSGASALSGVTYDGILGMNVLKDYVVSFDLDQQSFTLKRAVPVDLAKGVMAIPLIRRSPHARLTVPAWINGRGPIDVRIDTGSNGYLDLDEEDWHTAFSIEPPVVRSTPVIGARGAAGVIKKARLSVLLIGTNYYTNIIVGTSRANPFSSTLGFAFLRQHRVTIDYPHQRLFLERRNQDKELLEDDMSGLRLFRPSAGPPTVVHSVEAESPAFKADIQAGDVVRSVNGREADQLNLKDLRDLLRTREGDTVTMKIQRDGLALERQFKLKRLL